MPFIYDGPGGFELPPTRFVGLSSDAALVSGIETSPLLTTVPLEPAISLLEKIAALVEAAGWNVSLTGMASIEEVRVEARDTRRGNIVRWPCAELRRGSVSLTLSIKRVSRASALSGLVGGNDAYLVNVEIYSPEFSKRASTIARTLQYEDGLGGDKVRSIDLHSYLARVRPMLEASGGPP